MNKEDFIDLLESYLNKHKNASCLAGRDAGGFVDKMYAMLLKDSPSDMNQWLKTNMEDRFLYASEPPKWTRRGEKDWLYFEDEPMIFLHQFSMGLKEAKRMKGKFPVGETIYVFGGNKKIDTDTWQAVYMMIGQDNSEGYRVYMDCL